MNKKHFLLREFIIILVAVFVGMVFAVMAKADTCSGSITGGNTITFTNTGGVNTCDDVVGSLTVNGGTLLTEDAFNLITIDTSVVNIACTTGTCSLNVGTDMLRATEFISQETGVELKNEWIGFVNSIGDFAYLIIRHAERGFNFGAASTGSISNLLLVDNDTCMGMTNGVSSINISNIVCIGSHAAGASVFNFTQASTGTLTDIWINGAGSRNVSQITDSASGMDWVGLVSIGTKSTFNTVGSTQVITGSYFHCTGAGPCLSLSDASIIDSVLTSGADSGDAIQFTGGTNNTVDGTDIIGFGRFAAFETGASNNLLVNVSMSGNNNASIENFDTTTNCTGTPAQCSTIDTITTPQGSLNRPLDFDTLVCTSPSDDTITCTFDSVEGNGSTAVRLDVVPYIQCGTTSGTYITESVKPTNISGPWHKASATTIADWKRTVAASWANWGDFTFGTTGHSVTLKVPGDTWFCRSCGVDPIERDFCSGAEHAGVLVASSGGGGGPGTFGPSQVGEGDATDAQVGEGE